MRIKLEFEPRDLWIGIYWRYDHAYYNMRHLFICLIPCLPIHITWVTH